MDIKSKVCSICGKVIESLYDKQLEYNYETHLESCKKKTIKNSGVVIE